MKKYFIVVLITVILAFAMASCSSEESQLTGSWYNTMNPEEELILTEDGSFSFHNNGGTYSVEGENLILNYAYGESEVFSIDNNEALIYDEFGDPFSKNKEQTIAIYEKNNKKETLEKYVNNNSDVQAQINSLSTDNMTVDVVDNTLTYTYTYSQIIDEAAVSDISLELEHAMASAETQFKDIRNTLEEESGIDGITVKVVYEDSVGTVLYSKEF